MNRSAPLAAALLALAACNGDAPADPPAAEAPTVDAPTSAAPTGDAAMQAAPSRIPAAVTVSTNEPFWQAAVAGETVTLTGVDSPRRVLRIDSDTVDASGRRVSARDAAGTVRVEISDRACVNDMSGAPFPLSGALTIDGRGPFRGCATPPGYRPPAEPAPELATAIPARFLGLWAADAAGCRVPPASIEWLRVTPEALRFHESLGAVRAVRPLGESAVELDLDFDGEGQQWQATRLLRRTGDVLTLSGADMPPISRTRCATGDEAAAVSNAETSPAAARDVVRRYYAAIDRRDYGTAHALWAAGGQASGQSAAAFANGFARTARTQVRAGAPTNAEGAAGSLFIEVPVEVEATLDDGTRQRFAGRYVLRRVNDVAGASADQLRWRIASASLQPVP
ncbi:MAG: hypothetical protein Q7J32_16350 [Sphingomonadaceae bacterium]|nr:hypothetical protein [Sphingomonadaceae bacterium]